MNLRLTLIVLIIGVVSASACASLRPDFSIQPVSSIAHIASSAESPMVAAVPYVPTPAEIALTQECSQLDSNYSIWGAIGAGAGGLSGLGGLGAGLEDDKTAKISLGITTAVVGGVAATAVFLSQHYASRYTTKCASDRK